MKKYFKISSFFSILLTCSIYNQGAFAQSGKGEAASAITEKVPPSQFIVACSPGKPIARPGETIPVRAYAASPAGKPLKYSWSAIAGQVIGQGPEVRWVFTDTPAGVYQAKVRVSDGGSEIFDCSMRVAVQAQPRVPTRGNRETGRSFLLSNEAETTGYGLYSYLLFGSRPSAASRERYLKAVEEFLRFPDITRYDVFNIPHRTLNITYLPLNTFPDAAALDQLADEQYGRVAEWALKQYDYERARVLLKGIAGSLRDGPYFLSVLKPPSWNNPPARPYLYQDLSAVPPHLASLWAKEFLNQAAQEQFWQARTAAQLALKLRTSIAILATGLPEVRNALNDWIAWAS